LPRPRRKRKPRPPGNFAVFCTGRGRHDRTHIRRGQVVTDDGRLGVVWDLREGPVPLASYREDGGQVFGLKCLTCGRNWERGGEDIAQRVIALGRAQGLTGSDNTPVAVDVSALGGV
jgi:hypothetical protein